MRIERTKLEGCYIIHDTVHGDKRGYFFESFHKNRFYEQTGLNIDFVQDNQSKSQRGVLRGLHFQQGEHAQAKLVGQYIQQKGKTYEMLVHLMIAGLVLIFTGFCWDMVFPVNKKIWTSSYVLYTTGLAILTISLFIYLIEFRGIKGAWSRFFDVFGKNPLFIFVLSGFLPRVLALIRFKDGNDLTSPLSWFWNHICKPISDDLRNGSLLYALVMIAFYWLIVYWMDKKKMYVKV